MNQYMSGFLFCLLSSYLDMRGLQGVTALIQRDDPMLALKVDRLRAAIRRDATDEEIFGILGVRPKG